jgi:hypothetical protein
MKQHRFDKDFQAIMEAVNNVYTPLDEASKYINYPRADFEKLKKGDKLKISYTDVGSGDIEATFVVTGKSRSKRYDTDKVAMMRDGGNPKALKYFLYSRKGGDATMAHGDMAVFMTNIKKV